MQHKSPLTPHPAEPASAPLLPGSSPKTRTVVLRASRRSVVALVLLLVLGILPGWILLWQGSKNSDAVPADARSAAAGTPIACNSGLKSYENTFLDIGFCYPVSWGEVLVHEGKYEPADTGSRWRLGFTNKTQVSLGLVSADWSSTIPRNPRCSDPAQQTLPSTVNFSTSWRTEGNPVASAQRGIEKLDGYYLLEERVSDQSDNGACLIGYTITGGTYRHTVSAYLSEYSPVINSPEHHITDPNVLIPAPDRGKFADFIKSIRSL